MIERLPSRLAALSTLAAVAAAALATPARAQSLAPADTGSTVEALHRLATERARAGEHDAAIALYQRRLREAPDDVTARLGLARTLAWAGRTAAAVALFDSIAASPTPTLGAPAREAALGAAQALAWSRDHEGALRRYERWLAAHPADAEAAAQHAQTLAWAGRLDEAEAGYARLLTATAGDPATAALATRGLARVAAWRSDFARSERLWRTVVARHPGDAEAWAGLAQTLRVTGRLREAEAAVARALAAEPGHADAIAQRRLVRVALRPTAEPRVTRDGDSDGNRSTITTLGVAVPAASGAYTIAVQQRDARGAGTHGLSRALRVGGRWTAGTALRLRAEVGVSEQRADGAAARTTATASASASARLSPTASVGVGVSHAPFDETAALMRAGVSTTGVDVEGEVALSGGIALSLAAGSTALHGAPTSNRRHSGAATLAWAAVPGVQLTAGVRAFGYAVSVREGYFAPERHTLGEVGARWMVGGDLGWRLQADAGVGVQQLVLPDARTTRGAQRGGVTVAFRPRPGTELSVGAAIANVATAGSAVPVGGSQAYRAGAVTLGAVLGF